MTVNTRGYTQPQRGLTGPAGNVKTFDFGTQTIAAADLALDRVVALGKIPSGFVLMSIIYVVTDMDTNGAPALAFDIGDSGSAARFVSAATTGQAGGTGTTLAAAGLYYEFTAETEILWHTQTASATAAAGTIRLFMTGYVK